MDFEKVAAAAFADEMQKIADAMGVDIDGPRPEVIAEMMQKEAIFAGMMQGLQRAGSAIGAGAKAVGTGVANQYGQLQNHVGNALANAGGSMGGSAVMGGTNLNPYMQGAGSYLADKLHGAGAAGHQLAHAAQETAMHSANPALAGMKPALGHVIGHGIQHAVGHMPGALGAVGSLAAPLLGNLGAGVAAAGAGALAKRVGGALGQGVQHAIHAVG